MHAVSNKVSVTLLLSDPPNCSRFLHPFLVLRPQPRKIAVSMLKEVKQIISILALDVSLMKTTDDLPLQVLIL